MCHRAFMDAGMVVRLRPDLAVGHLRKGMALRALGNPAQAEASLQECLRLDPTCEAAREALGLGHRAGEGRVTESPELSEELAAKAVSLESPRRSEERAFRCAECGLAA